MTRLSLTPANTCPTSGMSGCFVGRVWLPGDSGGPTPVLVTDEGVFDISSVSPTLSGLLAADDPYAVARSGKGQELGDVADILANTFFQDSSSPIYGEISMEIIEHQGKAGLFGRRAGCCLIWRTREGDGYCANCILQPKEEQTQRFREMIAAGR